MHGLALLGDPWLHPGAARPDDPVRDGLPAAVHRPRASSRGYLAALLGLSFYARRRIGVKLWRRLHRATVLVWVLGVVHTLGAGSDAATLWLRAFVLRPAIPIVYLTVLRMPAEPHAARRATRRGARDGERNAAARCAPALAEEGTS